MNRTMDEHWNLLPEYLKETHSACIKEINRLTRISTEQAVKIERLEEGLREAKMILAHYAELPTKDQCNFGHPEVSGFGGPAQTWLSKYGTEPQGKD